MEIQVLDENFMTRYTPGSAVVLLPSEYERLKSLFMVRYRSRGRHQPGSGNYACVHLHRRTLPPYRGQFILFPGAYYEYDDGWLGGLQQFCSFDCVGKTYRFVKAQKRLGRWEFRQAWAFTIERQSGSYPWRMTAVARCTSYHGSGIPRTTNVVWEPSSGWTENQRGYTINTPVDQFSARFALGETVDAFSLFPPLAIQNLVANAYVDAISQAPVNNVNNIGNILSVYDLLKSLMAGPQMILAQGVDDVVKTVADAWLQYRYVYQTTSMDIHETAEYILRSADVQRNGSCKCNGYQTLTVEGATYTARCSVTLTPENYSSLQSELRRFGLELNAYAAWDMVPWSFVVDWFLHIGDRLEYYDKRNRAIRLSPGPCWYSINKVYVDECLGANVNFYYRWSGPKPAVSGCFVDHPTSNSTIVKRAADVWALTR